MELKSPAFKDSKYIPKKYTCAGEDISPPLEIYDVPANARNLVLMVNDPDAPNGDWVHWLLWNIDPRTSFIEKDSVPEGAIAGVTSAGIHSYSGPCPAEGTHVYIFKLYALDILLPDNSTLKKHQIKEMMEGHVLDKAVLKGFYETEYMV